MKYLIVIWSLLISSMAVMPCADAAADCGEEVHWHETASHDHQEAEGADVCSPFCFCHCCHLHTVVVEVSEEVFIDHTGKNKNHFTASHYSQTFYSIWHPPKG
jgi:hypothetical protein